MLLLTHAVLVRVLSAGHERKSSVKREAPLRNWFPQTDLEAGLRGFFLISD